MAANAQATKATDASPAGKPEEWTEEQLEDALLKLKVLHIKCRELRTTIPRMLEPLTTKHVTPQDAFRSLQSSIANASTELRDFGNLYTAEDSRKVLEQAKMSREAQPEDIRAWRAKEHPDWLDMGEKSATP